MKQLRIGISTQTPLVRIDRANGPPSPGSGNGTGEAVVNLEEGNFQVSAGGVSRMMLQTVRQWHAMGWMQEGHWFCLQPEGPERFRLPSFHLEIYHLRLANGEMEAYGRTKEKLWADLHGLPSEGFSLEDFRFYARYNWYTGDAMMARARELDAVFVHDFQLLQVGAIVGLTAPSILRWHVPFDPQRIPRYTRNFVLRLMEDFDGVVVSTRRDLQGLLNAGFRGKVLQDYPHTDLKDWPTPTSERREEFERRAGLTAENPVVLCVARMDPIKRQDVLVRAMATLRTRHPKARAVLVGNGSFSSMRGSGLGLGKAAQWRAQLEELVRNLHLEEHVTFTGWLPDPLVFAAYDRASVLVLPSEIEGFGLTAFEAWAYRKPCVLSSGCGSAEVIQEGLNGATFPSGDHEALAARLDELLSNPTTAEKMGEAGNISLASYTVQQSAPRQAAFIEEAILRSQRT